MKLNQQHHRFHNICLLLLFLMYGKAHSQHGIVQDDSVLAPNATVVPVIDGKGDDACWQNVPWQPIAQVWIPYGATVDSSDYWGHYKVVWSSTTNLLYFLIEVHDDVIVDGFVSGVTSDIYNFDISEIFIDEDASGGVHMYDGPGINAENAFGYHMYADCPPDGEVTTVCHVDDMAGTQSNSHRADYTSHFPEFALRKTGDTYVREFSLIVYNDTYSESNKEAARSQLTVGKLMGLSVAYCDNDDPNENPKVRDNMFGSVWEPSPGNLHWQNADYFGHVKLVSEISTGIKNEQPPAGDVLKVFPNPFNPSTTIRYHLPQAAHVDLSIYNILGQCIQRLVNTYQTDGTYSVQWNGQAKGTTAASGIYFARLNAVGSQGTQSQIQRMVLLK